MQSTSLTAVLRRILSKACISYTVIALLICFILTGIADKVAISSISFLLIFPFSVCFAAANELLRTERLNGLLKFVFHAVLTIGGFFCFLYLPAFSGNGGASSLVVLAVFALLYFAVYGAIALFRSRWKKQLRMEADYKPQFSKAEEDGSRKR